MVKVTTPWCERDVLRSEIVHIPDFSREINSLATSILVSAFFASSVKEVTRFLGEVIRAWGHLPAIRRVRRGSRAVCPPTQTAVPLRSTSIARVRRTFKSLGRPEAPRWRSPNFSACTRNRSRPERNLDRSRSPGRAESPETGTARTSACIHRGPRRTLLTRNNASIFVCCAVFDREEEHSTGLTERERRKPTRSRILGNLLLACDTSLLGNRLGKYRSKKALKVGFLLARPVRPTVLHSNRRDSPPTSRSR